MERKFFLILICFIFNANVAFATPDFNPAILNPAGTINTHDMETLKRFEQERQEEKDFQKYKENNEKKVNPLTEDEKKYPHINQSNL